MVSITKIFRFEAAHFISNHKGLCKNIHGHSYELHVSVVSEMTNDSEMIIDFKELKKIVNQNVLSDLDHSLIIKKNEKNALQLMAVNTKITWLESEPTVEALINEIAEKIIQALPNDIKLSKLKLFETNTSYATWVNHL